MPGWACADCGVQVRSAVQANPLLLPQARAALEAEARPTYAHGGSDQCTASRHDHGPLPDAKAWFGCCICCVNRGLAPAWCEYCAAKWRQLRAFEKGCSADFGDDGGAGAQRLVDSAGATRKLVGKALRYRLDLVCASLLLQSPEGVEALVQEVARGGFRAECTDAHGTASVLGSDGTLDLSVRAGSLQCPRSEQACAGFRRSIPAHLLVRCIAAGPFEKLDGILKAVNVSGNARLERLPLTSLAGVGSLTALDCAGCPRLCCPPGEIAAQGGKVVLTYGKQLAQDSCTISSMQLITMGSAARTTRAQLVRALMHAEHPHRGGQGTRRSGSEAQGRGGGGDSGGGGGGGGGRCNENKIRCSENEANVWRPDTGDGLAWDLGDCAGADGLTFSGVQHLREAGGSGELSNNNNNNNELSNALLCARRALYLLVYRITSDTDPAERVREVTQALTKLQLLVPGARVILVAITGGTGNRREGEEESGRRSGGNNGCGSDEEAAPVRVACREVERAVRRLVSRLSLGELQHGTPALAVCNAGDTICISSSFVACEALQEGHAGGGDVGEPPAAGGSAARVLLKLRRACVDAAHAAPWWQEHVPASFARLHQAMRAENGAKAGALRRSVPVCSVDDWISLARRHGVTDDHLESCASLLDDLRIIRLFSLGHPPG